jgi:hypothetical protein
MHIVRVFDQREYDENLLAITYDYQITPVPGAAMAVEAYDLGDLTGWAAPSDEVREFHLLGPFAHCTFEVFHTVPIWTPTGTYYGDDIDNGEIMEFGGEISRLAYSGVGVVQLTNQLIYIANHPEVHDVPSIEYPELGFSIPALSDGGKFLWRPHPSLHFVVTHLTGREYGPDGSFETTDYMVDRPPYQITMRNWVVTAIHGDRRVKHSYTYSTNLLQSLN